MSSPYSHLTMEQNHKHYRRRRPVAVEEEQQHQLAFTSPITNLILPQISPKLLLPRANCLAVAVVSLFLVTSLFFSCAQAQQQTFFLPGHNMENLRIPESQPVDSIVYKLKAVDQLFNRNFTYHMTNDMFKVNESTGEVRLMKPLDRERQPQLSVVISAFFAGSDDAVETKKRTIIVEDIDDSWPIFLPHRNSIPSSAGQYIYQVDVSEQAPINTIVIGEIQVADADEGANAEIIFECRPRQSTNDACGVFGIESRRLAGRYSVTIKTRAPLDFEYIQSYKLSLNARGRTISPIKGTPLETEAVININLANVQDENPVFVNAPYTLSMPERLKSGTHLLDLIVQDGDAAPQRNLTVIVVGSPYSEFFKVEKDLTNDKMWYLETNATIDRENPLISDSGNMFTISLLAAELDENGLPIASDIELNNAINEPYYSKGTIRKENITVMVLDLPDSEPVFVRAGSGAPIGNKQLVVNVSEAIATGASIPNLDLAVHDLDQGINSRFKVSLIDSHMGPLASQVFALESEIVYGKAEIVLNILNSSSLDYENPELRTYRFNLVASKGVDNSLKSMIELQINIQDANDNAPEFDRDQYVVEVPEGALPGALVATIKARDLDSGIFGKVEYNLRGIGASKFKLISSEGKIMVNDCGVAQCIDYEIQPSFSLTYEARDGGGRTENVSVIINVIDVNDHAPRFTESIYKRELISDNLSSKQNYISPQLIVRARDGDGLTQGKNNITYRIKSTNLTGLDVEPISGLMYFSQPLDLDNMISAANNGRVGDKKIMFEAEVIAEDNGSPMQSSTAKIQLVVKGNRDGAPQFRQDLYQAIVRENQPVNKAFFQVQAIDPDDKDSQLRYSLGYDLNDLININNITGELSFKTKVDYDDFKGVPYNITVFATDNSKPYPLRASAKVSISIHDVNDKSPKFEEKEYKATLIQGQTKLGEVVQRVNAIDLDQNANLSYSIISDQLSVYDRNGQYFTLADVANLSTGYLSQMSPANRMKMVTNLRKLFFINKKTGAIELRQEPDYSFAALVTILVRVQDLNQELFTLTNDVQEDFVACTFYLQTHVDKSPIFAPPWTIERRDYNISIMEELSPGTVIFSLLAKDPTTNNRIESFEKVFESDPKDLFRVERSLVMINKRIDCDELPQSKRLSLSIKALTDDVFFSVANLNIQVIDLNDNAPQFKSQNYSVSISESAVYPQEILTVSAEDRDSAEYGQVNYALSGYSSEYFTIDPRKGVIKVKKGVRLDRDTEPSHSLFVIASDCNETRPIHLSMEQSQHENSRQSSDSGCKRSSVIVSVTLIDENDNDPVFSNVNKRGEYEAVTSETVSVGSVIAQVSASDIDEGVNGQVGYEIVRSDDPLTRLIRIDQDGLISVAESLSGLGRANPYRIVIRAYDNGKSNQRQSFVNLLLTISDVVANDGVPRFIRPKPNEVVTLSESAGPSTFVFQAQAVDPDEESNGKLMYKFIQPSDIFEIDPFTGIIKTQYRPKFHLDREQVSNYTLIIVAQDLGTPPKQAHQVLYIHISDVNDNDPYFERGIDDPPVLLQVEEEVPKDHLVGTIQALDRDTGQNALIGYEIIEGNHDSMFRLDYEIFEGNLSEAAGNNPCRIYSTARLDREVRESYTLTIKVSSMSKLRNQFTHQFRDSLSGRAGMFNQYNASDLTKLRVTIKLLDINDNRPTFAQQHSKSVVDSSAEIYSQLMVFKANDADSSNPDIQYSILDVLYYSDAKFRQLEDQQANSLGGYQYQSANNPISTRQVFDVEPRSGILRNAVSLRPYTDGYFEVYVKADSGLHQLSAREAEESLYLQSSKKLSGNRCAAIDGKSSAINNTAPAAPFAELENCFVAVTKAVVFVTHQRETFRFVFNKTKLNDRLDEFKSQVQNALEELMFEQTPVQASTDGGASGNGVPVAAESARAEKIYLNTFNTDFYEREDGSLDFLTLTSCSQLVKFDDRSANQPDLIGGSGRSTTVVPNQVISYDDVLSLLKTLNATQTRQQKVSLFNQYGLVSIERCLSDKTMYKMSVSERVALYFAAAIALISAFLAYIVHQMRKSYEKNLKMLQRSKYQYMSPYGTLAGAGMAQARPAHHMSMGTLPSNNFMVPNYGSQMLDFDNAAAYDTWQL